MSQPRLAIPAAPTQLITGHLRAFPGHIDKQMSDQYGFTLHSPTRDLRRQQCLSELSAAGIDIGAEVPGADYEDFWEDALRMSAAITACKRAGLDFALVESGADELDRGHDHRRLGPVSGGEEQRHGDDPLLVHPVLRAHAGRELAVCTYYAETDDEGRPRVGPAQPDDMVAFLVKLARAGYSHVVIKNAGRKEGVRTVPTDTDPTRMRRTLWRDEDFGWELIRMEGRTGSFLVQGWIPMTYEYRLFFVDGVPITGAATIEEFTPLDCQVDLHPHQRHLRLDAQMRRTRDNAVVAAGLGRDLDVADIMVETRADLVARYARFAQELSQELPVGQAGSTVVIDVAINPDTDEIVVIELNTLPNAGLYACDVEALFVALVRAHDRGYWSYAFK